MIVSVAMIVAFAGSRTAMSIPSKRILVIEDDREIARLIVEELTDRGYDVRIAHDGREGCSAILNAKPDLVLSDVMMPTMSGFDVLEMLASAAPPLRGVPFVFLTGLCGRDVEFKARELGADALRRWTGSLPRASPAHPAPRRERRRSTMCRRRRARLPRKGDVSPRIEVQVQ